MVQRTATIDELIASYLGELEARTPGSHALHEEARKVLAGGVSSHFKAWQPFYVREAKGSRVVVLPWDEIDAVAPLVRRSADELAAVILEPVPFSNLGGQEPDHEFMRSLRELTWERGILLVFDEVITGFRIALGGAAEHFGFAPDLHCLGN